MKFSFLKSLQIGSILLLTLAPQTAFCADEKKKDDDVSFEQWIKKIGDKDGLKNRDIHDILSSQMKEGGALLPLKKAFESGLAGQVGYGFLMGYSSGYCIKRISKMAAFFVGASFIFIQILQHGGYINVNYDRVEKDVEGALDLNNDGKFDMADVDIANKKVMEILSFHIPAGGGFASGFVMGIRG